MYKVNTVELQNDFSNLGATHDLESAAEIAKTWDVVHRPWSHCGAFFTRVRNASRELKKLEKALAHRKPDASDEPDSHSLENVLMELAASDGLLRAAITGLTDDKKRLERLPRIVCAKGSEEPRIAAVACTYLCAVGGEFSAATLRRFLRAIQVHEALNVEELWAIGSLLRLRLLELILQMSNSLLASDEREQISSLRTNLKSLKSVSNADWVFLLEPIISFDAILAQDPVGMYQEMDSESRELYRRRIAFVARFSDCTESQVAQIAVELAREGDTLSSVDPRVQNRKKHVGYYLIDKGFSQLARRVGFHPPFADRFRRFVRAHSDDVYLTTISVLTILIVAAAIFPVLPLIRTFWVLVLAIVVLLLPASQIAVEFVNNAICALFKPEGLPKLDFSRGVREDCATMVAVPCLLINELQVRDLVNDLEVRYLANRDPNIHFALLTDLPDSVTKPHAKDSHPLVDLAVSLIADLNTKYRNSGGGSFILLHRHRQFNRRQGVWMGWERKRGKLLDLNSFLSGDNDAFPIKAGNTDTLYKVRYVLTLDADTQLPRGTAARLIGTMAHPLNQAVIHPKLCVVTEGYGILQPRTGIRVSATIRSRMARIYSGHSGLDIYSRAISDAYQDLFGEGIFAGKGIYEVETLHAVLKGRFPNNTLLSHDLIEGAYARAGLATDIELFDDYPSHYSAHSRRKHRWVRGDWQIAQWISSRVPNEAGRLVPNPISHISRWKILDNLRRSMVQPFSFVLFVAGWLRLRGGPAYWTIVALLLLISPALIQLAFMLGRAIKNRRPGGIREVVSAFGRSALVAFVDLVLMAHQMLLAFDAIVRSAIRRLITGESLLEWETAAQAEMNSTKTSPVDWYLRSTPVLAVAIGLLVWAESPQPVTLICSLPILALWALALPVTYWLDATPRKRYTLDSSDNQFLSSQALLCWRYFQQFGTDRHNYLIPDNVQEENLCDAPRVSPTNIGLLLNARQAALEFGFLTLPEMAELTSKSLSTIGRLKKFRGHLYNWYDTHTLAPLSGAHFISSVDSGNFVASLYTLRSGVHHAQRNPLLSISQFSSLRLYWKQMLAEHKQPREIAKFPFPSDPANLDSWIEWLPAANAVLQKAVPSGSDQRSGNSWIIQTGDRVAAILAMLPGYLPWALPEYRGLRAIPELEFSEKSISLSLRDAVAFAQSLELRMSINWELIAADPSLAEAGQRLRRSIPMAVENLCKLESQLLRIEQESSALADATEFNFLVHPERQILSIGYDLSNDQIHDSCYDMIASEARIATFLAIARGDLAQQSWRNLSRDHVCAYGRFLLLSWTGTMFEYLMPALWMRSYPDTLIARSQEACVFVQRAFARAMRIPWGISESGSSRRNACGDYHYEAYGIPRIALSFEVTAGPVVSPYSTFLALSIDTREAIANLKRMVRAGWVGPFGLYESVDYSNDLRSPVITREWMAHHQGMSLLALLNLQRDNIVQSWFHDNPLVQSAELLLQEIPVSEALLKSTVCKAVSIRLN